MLKKDNENNNNEIICYLSMYIIAFIIYIVFIMNYSKEDFDRYLEYKLLSGDMF